MLTLGDISERAQRLRTELQDRLAEISTPHIQDPSTPNALSTLKTRIVGTFEDAEHKFLHLQEKWNRVDDEDEMKLRRRNNNRNTDEEEEETHGENEDSAYLGKLLVDFKQNLRERAKAQALRKEEQHLPSTTFVNPHAASKLTVENISYASATPNTAAHSSYYAVFSVESQSQATTRRKPPVSHNNSTVEWTKPIGIEINDVFADLQITLFTAQAQADRAVARCILPLSSLFNSSVYELAHLSVRKRTKTFILYLLPLKQSTRVLTRSVDGLQIGLQRSATQLGTITLQVTVETTQSFAYTLLAVPPTRELAPPAQESEVLDEVTLNKRKFRIQRLVPRFINLLTFHHDLLAWKNPYITAWFLYLDFALLFYLDVQHFPLFAAVYLISVGYANRLWYTAERVPLYQDQVAAEHVEVPNTVPKKVKAVADLLTKLQFAAGIMASVGEKLVMSWQQDALVAAVLAVALLVCGFTCTALATLLATFPIVWRTCVFVWVIELHLPSWLMVVPCPFAAAAAAAAAAPRTNSTLHHMWQGFLQRIPDSRELDHRTLAQEYRVEL